jgi:hypothetical protein
MALTALVGAAQRRLRLGMLLEGVAAGVLAVAASVAVLGLVGQAPGWGAVVGVVVAIGLVIAAARRAARQWTPLATALRIEARTAGLDNLVVTAIALDAGALQATEPMRAAVLRHAEARATAVQPRVVAPLGRPAWLALGATGGALAVVWAAFSVPAATPDATPVGAPAMPLRSIRATVTPPAYLGLPSGSIDDPQQLRLPAGARLRLEVRAATAMAWLEEPERPLRSLEPAGDGAFVLEWTPEVTHAVVVAVGDSAGQARQSHLLDVVVVPDQAPRVRIVEPGKDLAFLTPSGVVDVAIEASDAERVDGVRVAYVKMSGSGESFAFAEGEAPVTLERTSPQQWRGRARLSLGALALEDGDSLVYRAMVRDSNPDADWVSSDAFTIDVGKRLEFAGAGFAVPDEDRRYAISQQMVIVKTERLLAERGQTSGESWAERTRMLAIEQRMVRAEVVFLSGSEVQDEVEEAEHSHELQEGRLENAGRAEMLRAINEMSRAEARLNAGDASGALVFERNALAALQRAFDRRRYFLRTLAERSRIDPTRRLTGDRARAQSRARTNAGEPDDPGARARQLLRDLAALVDAGGTASPALLARLASVDTADGTWRQLASSLASATTPDARCAAAEAAMARMAAGAWAAADAGGPAVVVSDLRGWWREERRAGRQP